MTATEDLAVAALSDELAAAAGPRMYGMLERRRRSTTIKRRGWLVRRALLAADLGGLLLAFSVAEVLFASSQGIGVRYEALAFALTLPGWVVVTKLYRLYDRDEERTDHSTVDDFSGVFHLVTFGSWLFYAGASLTGVAHPTLPKVITFWLLAVLFITAGRAVARALSRRHITYLQNTIIVGAGDVGQLVARKLASHPEYGINLVGFVDSNPKQRRKDLGDLTVLGGPERLPALVRLFDIERVVIAFSNASHQALLELVRGLNELDVRVDIVPRLFEVLSPALDVHTVEGLPLLGLRPPRLTRSSAFLKRSLDLLGAALGLVLLMPLFALIAAAIMADSRGPVFFRQMRMGVGDRTFRIVKFRTMAPDAEQRKAAVAHLNKHAQDGGDPRMFKIDRDPRVTLVGRLLRRFSIDELPQLWNVLRGEMSLVGPRPLILDEHAHVTKWGKRRLDLRPGITGLWQVLGRDDIPFAEMVNLDYLYVTNWSVGGDLRLLLRTIPAVLRRGA